MIFCVTEMEKSYIYSATVCSSPPKQNPMIRDLTRPLRNEMILILLNIDAINAFNAKK